MTIYEDARWMMTDETLEISEQENSYDCGMDGGDTGHCGGSWTN